MILEKKKERNELKIQRRLILNSFFRTEILNLSMQKKFKYTKIIYTLKLWNLMQIWNDDDLFLI